MDLPSNLLVLEWKSTPCTLSDPPRSIESLGFVVDGQGFSEWLRWCQGEDFMGYVSGRVSCFARCFSAKLRTLYYRQLCGDLPGEADGRVPLYICTCGSIDCGALVVDVGVQGQSVVWSSFGVWNGPQLSGLPDLRFDLSGYRKSLRAGLF